MSSAGAPGPGAASEDLKNGPCSHGVDTIVALPQSYINFELQNLLNSGVTTAGRSLRDVEFSIGQSRWLRGKVSKLSTVLYVPGKPSSVKFIVEFGSGTMDLPPAPPGPPPPPVNIAGLAIGFEVNLKLRDVQQDETLPPEVRKEIEALLTNVGKGAFRVRQLLMDFENAALARHDPELSHFPPGMDEASRNAFKEQLHHYLTTLHQAGANTLGYSVKVDNPGGKADPVATFLPTDLRIVTNPYRAGGDPAALNPKLDTILFLMMTQGRSFPAEFPEWWGNFVSPETQDGMSYGRMLVSNRVFVQDFVLPRLSPIVNKQLLLNDSWENGLEPKFKEVTGTFEPFEFGGKWDPAASSSHSHVTNALSNDDAFYTYDVNTRLHVSNNVIVIGRVTRFTFKYVHWYGVTGHSLTSEAKVVYEIPLDIVITLTGIHDGQLNTSAALRTKEPKQNTLYGQPYGWYIKSWEGGPTVFADVINTFLTTFERAIQSAVPGTMLKDAVRQIEEGLRLSPFVFPGGNQLFMRDPKFVWLGDLALGLSYKK